MDLAAEVAAFFASLRPPAVEVALLGPDDNLVLGVSGGPDSLALLHLLVHHNLHPAGRLFVAHLDHGLRPTSDAEAAFVAERAADWGVACLTRRRDVAAEAREQGLTLEEAGRRARYALLAELADTVGAKVVATAHHAGDQAESVLMHLLRGAGLDGLRGMLPAGPVPGRPDLLLIRPLLGVSRAAIEAYVGEQGLSPIVDESNLETAFYRNWLRHELLPLLEQRNPQVAARLLQLAELARADVDLLDDLAGALWTDALLEQEEQWLALDRGRWAAAPLSLRRRLIRRAVLALEPEVRDVAFRPVEQARRLAEGHGSGRQATLPAAVSLIVEAERLVFHRAAAAADADRFPQVPTTHPLSLPVPGAVPLEGGWVLEATEVEGATPEAAAANPDPWTALVSIPPGARLVVRPRLRGERFRPLGMAGRHALVSTVMVNRKIPARWRGRWPIVATEAHLVWLVGHVLDERAAVTSTGKSAVRLSVFRSSSG